MTAILTLVRLTVLESFRRQIHLLTLFFAALLILVPAVSNTFDLTAPQRVVKDAGLTLIGFYGLLMAILLGSIMIPSEVERRTIFPLLARPMSRLTYLWGKFLGLFLILTISLVGLGLVMYTAMWGLLHVNDARIFSAILCYALEAGVLAAACIFFSTFSSPPLAATLGLFTYLVGSLSHVFINFFLTGGDVSPVTLIFVQTLKAALPHFEFFHIKDAVVHSRAVAPGYVGALTAYGIGWISLLMILAGFTFERRDL